MYFFGLRSFFTWTGDRMRIVLIGASGHGKVCAEIAKLVGYDRIIFLDSDISRRECAGNAVVGTCDDFERYIDENTFFFVSIGNIDDRKRLQKRIKRSLGQIASLIHPKAVVSNEVKLGEGSVVMAGAVVNPGTVIGRGCIINTCASIDHDCKVGDYVHVAVGSRVCGAVEVGMDTWIGAGSTISNNVRICERCIIGAGAVVVQDIKEEGTYVGVPAKKKK